MLGDEALSKELKSALVGKASGVKSPTASPVSSADVEGTGEGENQAGPDSSEKKRGIERQS
jgi:hypothetical protein